MLYFWTSTKTNNHPPTCADPHEKSCNIPWQNWWFHRDPKKWLIICNWVAIYNPVCFCCILYTSQKTQGFGNCSGGFLCLQWPTFLLVGHIKNLPGTVFNHSMDILQAPNLKNPGRKTRKKQHGAKCKTVRTLGKIKQLYTVLCSQDLQKRLL